MEHPLEKFKYCPVCGSSRFEVNNFKSKKCQDCGFTYYANPCSATAAFIVNDKQEMLVVRRAKEPAKGTLDLPGGFVDMGETVEQGMIREIKEEMDWDIFVGRHLCSVTHDYPDFSITLEAYLCKGGKGQFKLLEHLDYQWLKKSEMDGLDWTEADRKLLERI